MAKKLTAQDVVQNQFTVERELKAAGFPRLAIAALLGRIDVESGFNPTAVNKDDPNGGSVGIFQWNGSRRDSLIAFAAQQNADPEDVALQARFLAAEVKGEIGTEGRHGKRLLESSNPVEAVENVTRLARPSGFTPDNPQGGIGFRRSLLNATDYLAATNSPSARAQSPFAAGDTSGAIEQATATATGKIPGTLLDKILLGVTQGLKKIGEADLPDTTRPVEPVDIATNLLSKSRPSVTNFLKTLPSVGLGSIKPLG